MNEILQQLKREKNITKSWMKTIDKIQDDVFMCEMNFQKDIITLEREYVEAENDLERQKEIDDKFR